MTDKLPIFFQQLTAFDTIHHSKLRFKADDNYIFASKTNVIPLVASELVQSLKHYPIVFIPDEKNESPTLVAVVGLADGINQFVDSNGLWRPEIYIPAYVRGYPFLAVNKNEDQDSVLAFDPTASHFKNKDGIALVGKDAKPTDQLQTIMAFQNEYQLMLEHTRRMSKALNDAGLLEPGVINVNPGDGTEPRQIKGFLIVSENKLKALDDESLQMLHELDALGLAYAQLFSLMSLPNVTKFISK